MPGSRPACSPTGLSVTGCVPTKPECSYRAATCPDRRRRTARPDREPARLPSWPATGRRCRRATARRRTAAPGRHRSHRATARPPAVLRHSRRAGRARTGDRLASRLPRGARLGRDAVPGLGRPFEAQIAIALSHLRGRAVHRDAHGLGPRWPPQRESRSLCRADLDVTRSAAARAAAASARAAGRRRRSPRRGTGRRGPCRRRSARSTTARPGTRDSRAWCSTTTPGPRSRLPSCPGGRTSASRSRRW